MTPVRWRSGACSPHPRVCARSPKQRAPCGTAARTPAAAVRCRRLRALCAAPTLRDPQPRATERAHHEAYVSAKESSAPPPSRVPRTDADSRRPGGGRSSPSKGPLAAHCVSPAAVLADVSELERLTRSADVRRTLQSARGARGRVVDVRFRDRGDGAPTRLAVVAGRRVGGAVARNRAKRRLRAAARDVCPGPGQDLVLIAKPGCAQAPYAELREDVATAISERGARGGRGRSA